MSGPLINRSLTTIKTELEFLRDSEVITEELYSKLLGALPPKYTKDMHAWGVDKLGASASNQKSAEDKLSQDLAQTSISAPPSRPPATSQNGYCKVLYDYKSEQDGDLNMNAGDKIAITEILSDDWWKGYKKGQSESSAGVFPSNYVEKIPEKVFNDTERKGAELPAPPSYEENKNEKSSYAPPQQPPMNYGPSQGYQPQYLQQGYSANPPFPPPSTNYYPPQQTQNQEVIQQQPQQQQGLGHNHLKKFGSKLGNAAIFGAGATIGSDIVNSIF